MADEDNTPVESQWDSEILTAACYCLECLKDIDGKLFSKAEEDRINATRRRMLRLIHATSKNIHHTYFDIPNEVKEEEED